MFHLLRVLVPIILTNHRAIPHPEIILKIKQELRTLATKSMPLTLQERNGAIPNKLNRKGWWSGINEPMITQFHISQQP